MYLFGEQEKCLGFFSFDFFAIELFERLLTPFQMYVVQVFLTSPLAVSPTLLLPLLCRDFLVWDISSGFAFVAYTLRSKKKKKKTIAQITVVIDFPRSLFLEVLTGFSLFWDDFFYIMIWEETDRQTELWPTSSVPPTGCKGWDGAEMKKAARASV